MRPLEFTPGIHRLDIGRDLAISDESEAKFQEFVAAGGLPVVRAPFALGDVSFHSGWTFHRAGPNRTNQPRAVMTVISMDMDSRLTAPIHPEQLNDWKLWMPGATVGEVVQSPLNPILFEE